MTDRKAKHGFKCIVVWTFLLLAGCEVSSSRESCGDVMEQARALYGSPDSFSNQRPGPYDAYSLIITWWYFDEGKVYQFTYGNDTERAQCSWSVADVEPTAAQ